MLFLAALAAGSPQTLSASSLAKNGFELAVSSKTVLKGHSATAGFKQSEVVSTDAKPVYLGYPHGPKTSEFVPAGAKAETLVVKLQGPIEATVIASKDSFACSDLASAPLGSTFGNASSTLDNGVYDRTSDWLLTAEGAGVRISPSGRGRYVLRVGQGPCTLRLRGDYYRNHLGYFLWDRKKPLWQPPVAGWCSWMAHLQEVTENDVLAAARFFSANLRDYGYDVIQIDDGYQRVSQFPQGDVALKGPFSSYWSVPNEKFPGGLKSLARQISNLGMTPGIWVGDYIPLGLKHADGYVTDPDGKPHKGPWVNYAMNGLNAAARNEAYIDTVRALRAEGWRYFKIDTLRHVLYDSYRQIPDYWTKRGESMEQAYRTILAETKKAAGPNTYLLACWGTIPELAGLPDGARIGEDVGPDVASMRRSAKDIAQFQHLNNVVWRNDPDYMCLRVPVPQAQTWATLTSLAGGHVMVSDPVKDYDPARVDVLRRVGPPIFTRPSVVVPHQPDPELFTLNAEKNGERWLVAARFGWGDKPERVASMAELGLESGTDYIGFDFWNEKFLGVGRDRFVFHPLTEGECEVVSLRPLLGHPQVLGSSRHIGQGAYELEKVAWANNTLSGQFKRGVGRAWSLYLHVPSGWHIGEVSSELTAHQEGEVLKLTFPEGSSLADWSVRFTR